MPDADTGFSLAVMIPAHNEAAALGQTLLSISRAIDLAARSCAGLQATVTVGADGCTDATAQVAAAHGAEVISSAVRRGKWRTLSELCTRNRSRWVALVDAGAVWPENFIVRCLAPCADESAMAVAPAYRSAGGALERWLWNFERHLKRLEDAAGGPISLHGATVLYRSRELKFALAELDRRSGDWLNDDVVLPLLLRAQNPDKRVRYLPDVIVADGCGARPRRHAAPQSFVRRRRLLLGNLQWLERLFGRVYAANRVAGILALRRLFRMLWAYWGLAAAAAAALQLGAFDWHAQPGWWLIGVPTLLALSLLPPARDLTAAAQVSLLAPYYFWHGEFLRNTEWK